MDPLTITQMALGAGQAVSNFFKKKDAENAQRANVRPKLETPQGIKDNVSMWQNVAQSGIGEDAMSRLNEKAMQGLTAALQSGLMTGASPNNVGDYYGNYLAGLNDLFVKDASIKLNNIAQAGEAKKVLSDWQFMEFGYNQDAPYKDNAQLIAANKAAATQGMFSGLSTMVNGWAGGESRKLYKDYLATATAKPAVVAPYVVPSQDLFGGRPTIGHGINADGTNLINPAMTMEQARKTMG